MKSRTVLRFLRFVFAGAGVGMIHTALKYPDLADWGILLVVWAIIASEPPA